MGQIIELRGRIKTNETVIKAIRLLLHRAKTEGIEGFAFVALKATTVCYGVVNIEDQVAALDAAETLVDLIEQYAGHFRIENITD